ncbi:MAG: anthranilate synthase component I family protein [Candidatus Margulisbacteria bacterium]|nr:anthranilate synthase component I family protein [Candidatus Margulisiibacteriota bacterium]
MEVIQAGEQSPLSIFESLYNGKGSFLLESPTGMGNLGRYSYIGINPLQIITDFETLRKADLHQGAFGFISYDFARRIENLPSLAKDDLNLPEIFFVIPEKLVIIDHHVGQEPRPELGRRHIPCHASRLASRSGQTGRQGIKPCPTIPQLKSNFSQAEFESMVLRAKEYIKAGDIYQVNLSQRFELPLKEHPFEVYKRLRKINPSPFACYFDFGDFQLASCSPERLIKLENGIAETRPIAGTRPKQAAADELLLDPKERAEHIMLVDLERNDLGKVCDYGSVHVDENMVVEEYSHVKHIVSNVKGKLRSDKDCFDLLQAMFPGGTITGCPKVRSMEIIEELEPVRRGPYTGSVGYILQGGRMDFNILIRTIVAKGHRAFVQAGAGIVADSIPEKEYHETLHKAQAMLEALR